MLSIPSPDWCHLSGKNTLLRDSFSVCAQKAFRHLLPHVYIIDFRAHVNCYPLCPAERHSEMFCQPCKGLFSFLRLGLDTHHFHSYSLFLVWFPLPLSITHSWKISALLLISVMSQQCWDNGTSPVRPLCCKLNMIIIPVVMLFFVLIFPTAQWEVWFCLHGTFRPTKGCGAVWLWCCKRSSGWSRRWLQWKRHSTTD